MVKTYYGIIGCGPGGKSLAEAIKIQSTAELKTVVSRNVIKAERFAQKIGVDTWYNDYHKLLQDKNIDAVCISTPHHLHASMSIDALEAGKHVICDKPMATKLEDADLMIKASEKSGMKLSIVSQHRFTDSSKKIRKEIANGFMGDLKFGEARAIMPRSQQYYNISKWNGRWDKAGGGVIINQAIHIIDLLRWFMGPVKHVFAQTDTIGHQIEVEDIASATIQFNNNALGTISATTTPFLGSPQEHLSISGTGGFVVLEKDIIKQGKIREQNLKSKLRNLYSINPIKLSYKKNYYARQIKDFTQSILEDTKPFVDGYEGRNTLELVLVMYESARKREIVNF